MISFLIIHKYSSSNVQNILPNIQVSFYECYIEMESSVSFQNKCEFTKSFLFGIPRSASNLIDKEYIRFNYKQIGHNSVVLTRANAFYKNLRSY
jgi:hypothetical protein